MQRLISAIRQVFNYAENDVPLGNIERSIREDVALSRTIISNLTRERNCFAKEITELREHLADVTRERDEVGRDYLKAIQFRAETANELQQAREQLATVQAEAAEMRNILECWERRKVDFGNAGMIGVDSVLIHRSRSAREGTAGRELLDELANLREQCKSLRDDSCDLHKLKPWMEQRPLASAGECFRHGSPAWDAAISFESERASNKRLRERNRELRDELRRNGERIRELERHVIECESAITELQSTPPKEQSPVWQYRTDGHNVVWRTIDGVSVEKKCKDDEFWSGSWNYQTWQACCGDTATYPCDENGKRLADGGAK